MQELEKLFTAALGIPSPWRITKLTFDSQAKKLDIQVDFEKGATFEYEEAESGETGRYKAYDTVDKTWRHLNFFEHECYLHARIPRVKPKTGGIKMILPAWSGCVNGFTLLFEALVLQMCRDMPVHRVSAILKTSDRKLWHVLECYVMKGLYLANYSQVNAVGMDETSLKRGHNYISMFVDLNTKSTMFISEGKDHKTVSNFVSNYQRTQSVTKQIDL
jgi:transposase